MTELRYAAYGSNLHPQRLTARVPSARLRGTGLLRGRSLHFHKQGMDGSGKCNVLPDGHGVYVAVYTMNTADKPVLDQIEHAGIGYDVAEVNVSGFGKCFTYFATETHIVDELAPYCWYHELVVQGCRFHDLPADYLAGLSAIDRVRDPDERRRRKNWDLIHSMRRSA